MKLNKVILIILVIFVSLTFSCISAADLDANATVEDGVMADTPSGHEIYVDDENGDDSNDGNSPDTSVKSFGHAVNLADDNSTIHLASGEYKGELNTNVIINKSLTIVGSSSTNFNGENVNSLFTVCDGVSVTFKNINFINSFKKPASYSDEVAYGAALDIKNAKVSIINCSFINNTISHDDTVSQYFYGGAISNFGDLSITDSRFIKNSLMPDSGVFGYGGAIYNRGKLSIDRSSFEKSYSKDFGNGAAIANDGELLINNSVIRDSYALQECKGSAIYNNGRLTLLNSLIENNTCSRSNFQFIFGAIYNCGDFTARGNIFRSNNAVYVQPMDFYKGSPAVYNVGNLNMTYNAFMNNLPFDGVARDVYFNGGELIDLNNNWWQTNENPYNDGERVNIDEVTSWFVFNMNPQYSRLNISDSVDIKAFCTLSNGKTPQIDFFPLFDVVFEANGEKTIAKLTDGNAVYNFNRTQNRGSYNISGEVSGFRQYVLVDVGKIISYVAFNVSSEITYLDDLKISVEVTAEDSNVPSGVVNLRIGDESYPINLTEGKGSLEIQNMIPGKYTLSFTYEGTEDYFKAFNSTEVRVSKSPVNLTASAKDVHVGENGNIVVNLAPYPAQGQAVVYVNGVRKSIAYLYNGNTNIALKNFAEGEYDIVIAYVGSNAFEAANASCKFKVKRYETSLNLTANDINVGENATISIRVDPSNLRGKAILNINGVNTTIFLENTDTVVNLHSLGAGRYDVCVMFEGDAKYAPSSASASFRVLKSPSSISVDIVQNDDDLNGTITIRTNPSNCTGGVGVYINYRLYELNLTDGVARFNVEFDKGTNYIYAFYRGNANYESATWNTTIGVADEFILIGQNVTAYEYNDFNYTIRLIEYNGIPMPSRKILASIGEATYNLTTDDDGIAYITLNLPVGSYDIYITYLNETIMRNIDVRAVEFNLTSSNVTYSENVTFKATFDKNITGRVNFVVVGILDEVIDINDGKAIYNACFNSGDYTVSARYVNDFFVSDEVKSSFRVSKADADLNVIIPQALPGQTQIIRIEAPKNMTGSIAIKVDGVTNICNITDDEAVLEIENISDGMHDVEITYDGDRNYNSYTKSMSFYIKEFSTDVILQIDDNVYGKTLTAIARVDENATGTITFNVLGLSKTVGIENGIANWSFSGIDVGTHTIEAFYSGNDKYQNASNTTSFKVSKADSTISLFTPGAYLNENIKIYAQLSPNATGKVLFSMDGYYSPRNKDIVNSMSLWYIEPLKTGNYTVRAVYSGDNNYYSSNTTFILEISQKKSVLSIVINDAGINDMVIAKVKLNSIDGEKITTKVKLIIQSRTYNVNVVEGEGSLNFGKLAPGNYTYTAQYEGSDEFSKASAEGSFKVSDTLLEVTLTSNDLTKYYKGSEKLSAKLSYLDNPIANAKIQIRISGSKYDLTTNSKGECALPINLKPGTYPAEIIFEGTSTYKASKINVTVKVLHTVEGTDVVKIYGTNKLYQAVFLDSTGKALGDTDVKFTISGKTYTVRTLPNGVAKINVNFKEGKYTITATNPVTGETAKNTITMRYRLSENKDLTKYFGGNEAYKVRAFNDDGKPVGAGEIVKITVSGKTYSVKTDKNGYASLPINLNPKTYTITAEYKGFKVSNKITVKPVLTASNISKKQSKTTSFQAKLVDTKGKPLAGKKITFKIEGKTFTANTNSNGIATATININLSVGTHTIVSSYGKSTITNRIIVSK